MSVVLGRQLGRDELGADRLAAHVACSCGFG